LYGQDDSRDSRPTKNKKINIQVSYLYGEDDSRENTFYLFEAYKGRAGDLFFCY
jgi:hypothetical protein